MGATGSKDARVSTRLSENEVQALEAVIKQSKTEGSLRDVIAKRFHRGTEDWLSAIWAFITQKSTNPGLKEIQFVYEIAVYGSLDDHVKFISFLLEHKSLPVEDFSLWLLQGAEIASPEWRYWKEINCPISEEPRKSFVEFLSKDHSGSKFDNLEVLLARRPIILTLLKAVFRHAFSCSEGHQNDLFPMLVDVDTNGPKPSIMSSAEVLFLNSLLPHDLTSEWRLVFSTSRNGQSFSTLLGRIVNQGPTVIVIRDTENHTFGGFASVSWTVGSNFTGDNRCFLFSLQPKMSMFVTTGYNEHYMYLNQQQQTLPNGLGMGGQHEYFGLWLDADFGIGHSSKTCTTYGDFFQLSKNPSFSVDHVEVWAVGRLPQPDPDSDEPNQRSILDRDPGAKALLEMIDRGNHSDGLREPEPE